MAKAIEPRNFMGETQNIKMSLNKLEILIIVSSKRLSKFVGKTFCKDKIQFKKLSQMTKAGVGRPFNIPNPSSSRLRLR